MNLSGSFEIFLRLLLLLGGLLLPGSMILRALRLPWSLAAVVAGSGVTLYLTVLVFSGFNARISQGSLTLALTAVTVIARLIPRRDNDAPSAPSRTSVPFFPQLGGWWPLYLIFWVIVSYRLVAQPLTGPDVYFRWSYLAEQMLRFGSLDFYPPRRAEDFVRYFWAESIPPGIASLYAWAYACGGSKHALWTTPVVALQLLSLHEMMWRLGARLGGIATARRAVLLAAACPLLTWSFLIGQETGLTALGVLGLVVCLGRMRDGPNAPSWAILAGIFAVSAASAREYGPVFAGVGLAAAWWLRVPFRVSAIYGIIALPLALAWPLRVWWLTGNPFFSLSVGGLFPVNPVFVAWTAWFHTAQADALTSGQSWFALGRYWLLWALPAALGLLSLIAGWRRPASCRREIHMITAFIGMVTVLWSLSIAHTAGGLFYSLRVMTPALVLLIAIASNAWAQFDLHRTFGRIGAVALALMLVESWPKTLVLPENPYRLAPREWVQSGAAFSAEVRASEHTLVAIVLALPDRGRLITDNAGLPRTLIDAGIEVVPLWSPEISWLFDRSLGGEEAARRWQDSKLRYVIVGKGSGAANFVQHEAHWPASHFNVRIAWETDSVLILEAIATLPPPNLP